MNDSDLCYLSGHAALRHFRDGTLSPVELVKAQRDAVTAHGATTNAFTDTYFDDAKKQAKESEKRYRSGRGTTPRALEGLTLAVKDVHDIAGKRTTYASVPYKDNIATSTNPACQRLIDAGAIVTAKTTTPEFCSAGIWRIVWRFGGRVSCRDDNTRHRIGYRRLNSGTRRLLWCCRL